MWSGIVSAFFAASGIFALWRHNGMADLLWGSLCVFCGITWAITWATKLQGNIRIFKEKDLEVGKVYEKKGDIYWDDRVIEMRGGVGKVNGGQYITLLVDKEGDKLLVSLKESAYSKFVVTADKNNRYQYISISVLLKHNLKTEHCSVFSF